MKRLLFVVCMMLFGVSAYAQTFNAGLDVFFSRYNAVLTQDNLTDVRFSDDLDIGRQQTLVDIYGALFTHGVSMRGFHTFRKNINGAGFLSEGQTGIVTTAKKKEPLWVSLDSGFSVSRVEVGLPLFRQGFMVEPFFVQNWAEQSFSLAGEKYNLSKTFRNSHSGLGLLYAQNLSRGETFLVKYFSTGRDNYFDARYIYHRDNIAISAGYTYRTFSVDFPGGRVDNTFSGPLLEIGWVF